MLKLFRPIFGSVPASIYKRILRYFGLAGIFFLVSLSSIYFVYRVFSERQIRINPDLFSAHVIIILVILIILYFLADGMRLYCVIRAMGSRIPFRYIIKLVFINIFISNVTPLATGGGIVQVYFMNQKGIPLGKATAATLIRTMLAALILFTLTPIIILAEPNLFRIFFHHNLFYIIAVVSSVYIAILWLILFQIGIVKRCLLWIIKLFKSLHLISGRRYRHLYLELSHELDLFSKSFRSYFSYSPMWAILSFLCTALYLFLLFSFSYVLIDELGYNVHLFTVLAFQVVVTFFMYFAPTPGATGVAEGGYGLLFAQLVQKQDIAMLTLAWRTLTIYIGVLIGIVIIYREFLTAKRRPGNGK